ncbi:MAG: hypothetical protein BEN19_08210 [Epulopiscium sp. Nuni2H_MBin003]|nr:MAG: hypothetical protein BEN19_08210 [Epulopiscium sp. Nuni2H_MBin003]
MRLMKKLALTVCSAFGFIGAGSFVMAASNATVDNKDIIVGSTLGYEVLDGEIVKNSNALNMFVTTNVNYTNEEFLIKGKDVAFIQELYVLDENHSSNVTIEYLSSDTLKVHVKDITNNMFMLPLSLEISGANPVLEIIGNGGISAQTINLSADTLSDKNIEIKFGETRNIPIEGKGFLGEVIIEEVVSNSLISPTTVVMNLETNSGLVFDATIGDTVTVTGVDGLSGTNTVATITGLSEYNQQLTLEIPALASNNIRGKISITDIPVTAENRKTGVLCEQVNLTVSIGDIVSTGMVSDVKEYKVNLTTSNNQNIIAGGTPQKVKFNITETVAGSLDSNLNIFISTKGADIINFEEVTVDGITFKAHKDAQGNITEIVGDIGPNFNSRIANCIELELELLAGVNETGNVKVIAEARNFSSNIELIVGAVENTLIIDTEPANVQIGIKEQNVGEIVIKETQANILEKYEQIVIELVSAERNHIQLEDITINSTNGIELNYQLINNYIVIDITRQSSAPGEIIISDMIFTVGQNTPIGDYDIKVGGTAISLKNAKLDNGNFTNTTKDSILIEDFIITHRDITQNTQPVVIPEVAPEVIIEYVPILPVTVQKVLDLNTNSITIGTDTTYLGATPYTTDNGTLMVAVRDIPAIFGLDADITVNNNVINIGDIQIAQNSDVLEINGIKMIMDEKVTLIDGRSYVSLKYIEFALRENLTILQ